MTETRHPRLAMADELLDAQLLRTVGAAPYGGADVGECLATARTVQGTDLDGWYSAWTELATTTAELAESARAAGRVETARAAFFRASNYHRNAGVLLMGAPLDPRLRSSNAAQTTAFRQGAALLAAPPEVVAIPFEGTTLPGYHFRAAGAGAATDGDPAGRVRRHRRGALLLQRRGRPRPRLRRARLRRSRPGLGPHPAGSGAARRLRPRRRRGRRLPPRAAGRRPGPHRADRAEPRRVPAPRAAADEPRLAAWSPTAARSACSPPRGTHARPLAAGLRKASGRPAS